MKPTRPVSGQVYGMASRIRHTHRMVSCAMFAGPPPLLMTRRPSSFMPSVCPSWRCVKKTQYRNPITAKTTKATIPPITCTNVLSLASNGMDASEGTRPTRKESIRYCTTRRPVTRVSALVTTGGVTAAEAAACWYAW